MNVQKNYEIGYGSFNHLPAMRDDKVLLHCRPKQWWIQNFIMGGADGREVRVWGGSCALSPEKKLNFYLKMVGFGAF